MLKLLKCLAIGVIIIICGAFSVMALEDPEPINARAVIVYNCESDTVLFSKNADEKIYPASTVKIMTAICAVEYYGINGLDRQVTVTSDMIRGIGGNSISLRTGERVTVRDLLYAVVLTGANDAANVLACDISGSVDAFVQLMNAKAAELGMNNTVYTNPSGLHDNAMTTTASDILTLAAYAYKNNTYAEICSNAKYDMPATNITGVRYITNRNYFISTAVEYKYYWRLVNGMNSGSTSQAGWCLVASAASDGLNYIAVVMDADRVTKVVSPAQKIENEDGTVTEIPEKTETTIYSYVDATTLIKWAMDRFSYRKAVDASTMICEIPVSLGQNVDHVTLLPAEAVEIFIANDVIMSEKVSYSWELKSDTLTAPVKTGEVGGLLTVWYDGKAVAQVDLIAKNNVERSQILFIMAELKKIVSSKTFIIAAVAAVILLFVYVISVAVWRQRRIDRARREFYKKNH